MKPFQPEFERRGVQNPRIVDLIELHPSTGQVVLSMVELRAWRGEKPQMQEIGNKFDAYLSYVLDGHLVKQYPAYKDCSVKMELLCAEPPRAADHGFFEAVKKFADDHEIEFVITVLDAEAYSRWKKELEAPSYGSH